MNIMFMNSLEKTMEDGEVFRARVSIAEQDGVWLVQWSEQLADGTTMDEIWYEGLPWHEMLTVFRERVFAKQCEGFSPLLEMRVSEQDELHGRAAYVRVLQYYGDTHADEALYEALRQWRLKRAAQEGRAPFLIASNRLLKMVSAFVPKSPEELKQIPGFGRAKVEQYGEELLAFTAETPSSTTFPLSWVEQVVHPAELNAWLLQDKERRRKAEADKQEAKRVILEAIDRQPTLDELQEKTGIGRRDLLLWLEELDREGVDLQPLVLSWLETVPQAQRDAAWEAFKQKGDRYLKPVLQAICDPEKLTSKETERTYEWLRLLRLDFRRAARLQATEEAS